MSKQAGEEILPWLRQCFNSGGKKMEGILKYAKKHFGPLSSLDKKFLTADIDILEGSGVILKDDKGVYRFPKKIRNK